MNKPALVQDQFAADPLVTTMNAFDGIFGKGNYQRAANTLAREDGLDQASAFIAGASLYECHSILKDLIDRVATHMGLAPELEDAADKIAAQIIADGD